MKVINETDKLLCHSFVLLPCSLVENKLEPFQFRKRVLRHDGFKTLHSSDMFDKDMSFHVFHSQMTVVDIAVPMLNAFWDIAFVKRASMEMERHAKVSVDVKVNLRYT